jgi:phthiodiolone/phenolphthiodiolone dimycocerosates ketoreductase
MSPTGLIGPNRLRGLRRRWPPSARCGVREANSSTASHPISRCETRYLICRPIAVSGPRMLRAAGRYGDGFFPGFPHRPQDYAQRLEVVRAAASDAGRDPMSIIAAVWLPVVTTRSRDDVDEALDSEIIKSWGLSASDEDFRRHGAQHPLGASFSGAQDLLPFNMDEQTALSHVAQIPPALLREKTLNGTPDEVIELAAQWRDCGVRYVVLVNAGPLQRSLRKGLATVQPFNKIIRGLKRL